MGSLYAKYISEREGKCIVEDERGFATYIFLADGKSVYIEEVYVLPDLRKNGVGASYVNEIERIAKQKGYTKLITSVAPKAKGSTSSLRAILGSGFELDSMDAGLIYFTKFIKSKKD